MKLRTLFILLIGVAFFMPSKAQPPGPPPPGHPPPLSEKAEQKIKALYVAFMTQELNLTSEESQKFWPLHAQFDSEMKQIHERNEGELEIEEAFLNVKKKYKEKFIKVLGPERTEDFYRKDRAFREKLIERIRKKRMQKNGMPPRKNKDFN